VRADRTSPQPGATRTQAGGGTVKAMSQGRGQRAPGLGQAKPVQGPAGPTSILVHGQGAGQPGSDRKPAGTSRGLRQPRIVGEGMARASWKGATADGKKQKSNPAGSLPIEPSRP
jgi:hypothetical protein